MKKEEDTIARIVSLIQARPTITVRELANELGYAQERSVYYWVKKTGHPGITSLREAVLAGMDHLESEIKKVDTSVSESPDYTTSMITGHEYAPWLLPGDELHVDRSRPPRDGELVLIRLPKQNEAVRRFLVGDPAILVHPSRPAEAIRISQKDLSNPSAPVQIIGSITRVIRRSP